MRTCIKEYSNRFATVEKMSDGTFDCFNEVSGLLVKSVDNWPEAKAFMVESSQHYAAVEKGRVA